MKPQHRSPRGKVILSPIPNPKRESPIALGSVSPENRDYNTPICLEPRILEWGINRGTALPGKA